MRHPARHRIRPTLGPRPAIVALIVLYVDQITKSLVRGGLAPCTAAACHQVQVGPIRILNATNSQGAFSIGSRSGMWVLVTILGALLLPVYGRRAARVASGGWGVPLALGLIAGGGFGNLIDRVLYGGVTDFVSAPGSLVFNVADVAVIVGTVTTIRLLVRSIALRPATKTVPAAER